MTAPNWRHKLAFKFTVWAGSALLVLTTAAAVAASHALEPYSVGQVLVYVLLFGLVITAILGSMTHILLNRPLNTLLGAAGRISHGDYDQPLDYKSNDEIGRLALAIEQIRLSVKEKTRALLESRQQYQTLFERVPCYISVQDRDFKLVAVNEMFERDFGAKIGEYCYSCYKGLEHKCINCAVEKSFVDAKVHSSEESVTDADGSKRHILNLTSPIFDAKGDIVAVMEMGTDITQVRRLEDELIRSEEKYRLFFNNDPNSIFVFDRANHEILDANHRALSAFGFSREELMGRSFNELLDPSERERFQSMLGNSGVLLPRLQMIAQDGGRRMVNLGTSFGEHMGRKAVIAAAADISEILQAEEQLVQAAKMATLGEMSAGIAHELNQPLTVLATSARILHKQAKRDQCQKDIVYEVADAVGEQVERATRIINHLREFGRKSKIEKTRMDLLAPVRGVFQLMGEQLRVHNIKVKLDVPQSLDPVWGDQNRLEQVFVNLVLNARDGIEELRQAKPDHEGLIYIQAGSEGDHVWVRISDNGAGMPESLQRRIFEPFFTTKEVGKGTGLGLSISFGIVRDYGGNIEVESRPGAGASFTVSLPRAGEEA